MRQPPPKAAFLLFGLLVAASPIADRQAWSQTNAERIGSEYIPVDAIATVVLDVADAMKSATLSMSPVELADAWCIENIGFPAHQIERVRAVVAAPGPGDPMFGAVLSLREDVDIKTLNPQRVNTERVVAIDGHDCFAIVSPMPLVLHVVNSRTLVVSTANYLGTMLRSAEPDATRGPLARMAEGAKHSGQLSALLAVEPVRPMAMGLLQSQAGELPPPISQFTKLPELLDAVLLRVDLDDNANGIGLVLLAGDETKASQLKAMIANGLDMGRQIGLAQALSQIRGDDAVADATRQYADRVANKIVASLSPTQAGRRLTISGSPTQGMAVNGVLVALLMPAVQAAQRATERNLSSTKLKNIGLAMHNYHSVYQHFPDDITTEDGIPLLSWRVAILPFIDEVQLYEQFHLDEPWDSPHNRTLVDRMPTVYAHPDEATEAGTTVYLRPRGEDFLFAPGKKVSFRNITDGTSNTLAAVETIAPKAVVWSQPADFDIDPNAPKAAVTDGERQGFHALQADGAVLFLSSEIDPGMFQAMLTKSGGEIIER